MGRGLSTRTRVGADGTELALEVGGDVDGAKLITEIEPM